MFIMIMACDGAAPPCPPSVDGRQLLFDDLFSANTDRAPSPLSLPNLTIVSCLFLVFGVLYLYIFVSLCCDTEVAPRGR